MRPFPLYKILAWLCYTQRNLFEIWLNQTGIRLYIPFSDWFGTKRTSAWFQINRKIVNTVWFWFDSIRFRKDFSVCSNIARLIFLIKVTIYIYLYNKWREECWLRGNGATQSATCCTKCKKGWVGIGHERFENSDSILGRHWFFTFYFLSERFNKDIWILVWLTRAFANEHR